ncbi:MAG: hypothetical protein WA672_17670 [Candidatus Angelobacter sp.]
MKKLLLLSAFFAAFAVQAFPQNLTTVSASNITDINGTKLSAGQLCFLITDQQDNPISVSIGGGGQSLRRGYCSPVASGAVTAFTVPTPAATAPAGIYYRVTVKDSSTGQEVLRYSGVTFTGATFNFDNYAPVINGSFAPLTGTSVSGNLSVTGNVAATGTVTGSNIAGGQVVTGAGTTNTVPKYTNGASAVIGNSSITDNGTTVSTSEPVSLGSTLAAGTNPAQSGTIRIPSGGSIIARNATNTADQQMAASTGGNTFKFGANGEILTNGGIDLEDGSSATKWRFTFATSEQKTGSTGVHSWTAGLATAAADTGISRTGVASIGIGNGTAGDTSGTLNAGGATVGKLNNTVYADQQSGADACAKITTAIGLLPATGGIVDATGFQGNQVCAAGVTFPANKPITLKLGAFALIAGANTAITVPGGAEACVIGMGPTAGGSGTTSVISSTASTAVEWDGTHGCLENVEILNGTGNGLTLTASGTNSVSHNRFSNLYINAAGVVNTGKIGLREIANSGTALVTENTFETIRIDDFDISEQLETSGAQGPTDNYHFGWTYSGFAGAGTAGIKIISGDVNTWTHGFTSLRTTGIRLTAGNFNMFLGNRFESGGIDVNDAGTGSLFIGNSFSNCTTSIFAATATLVGSTGNTNCNFDQFPRGLTVGSIKISGTAPICSFTTGGGTGPACVIGTGNTNSGGTIALIVGTGSPAASGTATLSFANIPFGTNIPSCVFWLSNRAGSNWNARATLIESTVSTSSVVFNWDNNGVALTASGNYQLHYLCFAD